MVTVRERWVELLTLQCLCRLVLERTSELQTIRLTTELSGGTNYDAFTYWSMYWSAFERWGVYLLPYWNAFKRLLRFGKKFNSQWVWIFELKWFMIFHLYHVTLFPPFTSVKQFLRAQRALSLECKPVFLLGICWNEDSILWVDPLGDFLVCFLLNCPQRKLKFQSATTTLVMMWVPKYGADHPVK